MTRFRLTLSRRGSGSMTRTHAVQPLLFGGYEHGPFVKGASRKSSARLASEFGHFHARRAARVRGSAASRAPVGEDGKNR